MGGLGARQGRARRRRSARCSSGTTTTSSALRYAGRVGTGFTEDAARPSSGGELAPLERDTTPFADPLESRAAEREVHFVEPQLVAEVRFTEWTSVGRIRHPAFLGLRDRQGPDARSSASTDAGRPAPSRSAGVGRLRAGGRRGARAARITARDRSGCSKSSVTVDRALGLRLRARRRRSRALPSRVGPRARRAARAGRPRPPSPTAVRRNLSTGRTALPRPRRLRVARAERLVDERVGLGEVVVVAGPITVVHRTLHATPGGRSLLVGALSGRRAPRRWRRATRGPRRPARRAPRRPGRCPCGPGCGTCGSWCTARCRGTASSIERADPLEVELVDRLAAEIAAHDPAGPHVGEAQRGVVEALLVEHDDRLVARVVERHRRRRLLLGREHRDRRRARRGSRARRRAPSACCASSACATSPRARSRAS